MKTTIHIARFDPKKDEKPHFETYEVVYEQGMRLLHALEHIKTERDPTLSYRWNCGAGRCGSCAAEVNGKPVLTCKYELLPQEKEITVEPMKVFPLVKDLVVDLTVLREDLKKIPGFKSKQKPFFKIYDYDIEIAKEMKKCIECGICQDVCHVLREHKAAYIGPRFIAKAASLDIHPTDEKKRAVKVEKLGTGYCNVTKCCQQVCPENIRITDNAIIPFKEKIAALHKKELFKK